MMSMDLIHNRLPVEY